jgi:hypothetical protein
MKPPPAVACLMYGAGGVGTRTVAARYTIPRRTAMCKGARYGAGLVLLIAAFPLATGCAYGRGEPLVIGDMVTDTQSFELGEVRSLHLELGVNIGSLRVGGGAEALADAEFRYNIADWKPKVDYRESGGRATLKIEQPDHQERAIPNKAENSWEIDLNNGVPISLRVDVGIGESVLALGGTSLTSLDIDQGIGEMTLDLTGEWSSDVDVNIDGGIGSATIRVPEDVGVRVKADAGIGGISALGFRKHRDAYVNEAYGESDVTIEIDVDAGIGSITIQVGREATAQT